MELSKLGKLKQIHSEKISYISENGTFYLKIRSEKISYIFLKKLFLYSGKRNFLILCKKSFSDISGNGTF